MAKKSHIQPRFRGRRKAARAARGSLLASAALVFCIARLSVSAAGAENIRLNQIGFYQYGPKRAVIVSSQAWRFAVKSPDLSVTYYSGDVRPPALWQAAGEVGAIADFSGFTRIGTYVVDVAGVGTSYPFRIEAAVHGNLMRGLLRAFYFQRASTDLPAQYAGQWARSAGHPDTRVIVHASAASDSSLSNGRRTGDVIASPKGWYDAGDYGKYVVNAGITVYTLLSLYERFPAYFDSVSLNIPRQYAGLPDILSEVKWELDWLLTMQDPSDGGVYHKLTSLGFCGFIMPSSDNDERYVIGKGSAATFDFAAVCAVAYRIYKRFLPSFADSCLAAARYAWSWGAAHPNVTFRNPADVTTGEYADGGLQDERQWAAIELFLATGDTLYRPQAFKTALGAGVPSWPQVSTLGTYSLAFITNDSQAVARDLIKAQAGVQATFVDGSPFHTVMYDQFYWGSNSVAANNGMLFIEAFLATKDPIFFERAVEALDYLVGRNALGYSFVTGFGNRSPRHPHHRPSAADGIDDPVPGFLVGGPNVQQNDAASCNLVYPSRYAAKSWMDEQCAYACNEVAINWNAPAAFLAGAVEAIYADTSNHVQTYRRDTLPSPLDSISVAELGPDHATITWETNRDVSASVAYGLDSSDLGFGPVFSADARHHSVRLTGLRPSTTYYFTVTAVDGFGAISVGDLESFTTVASGLLNGFVFNPAGVAVAQGVDILISFQALSGLHARLAFCVGGSNAFTGVACVEAHGTYSAIIPGSRVSPAGILFSMTFADSIDSVSTPRYCLVPSTQVECTTLVIPKAYQMISAPLMSATVGPENFFTSQLGDKAQWRYYAYSSDSGQYTSADSLRTGRGGWLYCAEKKTIRIQGRAVKPDSLFPIPLSKGWNVIGSPFTFPVYWENSLVRYGGVTLRLTDKYAGQIVRRQLFRYFDTTSDQLNNGQYVSNASAVFSLDTTRLWPWQGHWVYAEKSGAELLVNPGAAAPKAVMAKKTSPAAGGWLMRFSASVGGSVDNAAIIGALPEASDDYDDMDSPKPPTVSNDIRIGLAHPQWKEHGSLFASDIVAAGSDRSHQWRVAIKAGAAGAEVRLTWQRTGTVGGFLYLYDSVSGASLNMSSTDEYRVNLAPGEIRRDLTVRYSSHADKVVRMLPAVWSLGRGAPNPFKTTTSLAYCVPMPLAGSIAARQFQLAVYDMLGRRVKTLINGRGLPGQYTVEWNGTDDAGKRLKQGVYVIHLSADGFSASVKTQMME